MPQLHSDASNLLATAPQPHPHPARHELSGHRTGLLQLRLDRHRHPVCRLHHLCLRCAVLAQPGGFRLPDAGLDPGLRVLFHLGDQRLDLQLLDQLRVLRLRHPGGRHAAPLVENGCGGRSLHHAFVRCSDAAFSRIAAAGPDRGRHSGQRVGDPARVPGRASLERIPPDGAVPLRRRKGARIRAPAHRGRFPRRSPAKLHQFSDAAGDHSQAAARAI